ncbi:MAG: hypothetical protein LC746_00080 [Acidobacteria bacterium]|nr:hypothetical protein [Acidobacteriota bacterium]
MLKKVLTAALACLVVAVQAGARPADVGQGARDAQSSADVRAKLDRAGTGEKARVTVWLKDGAKHKGYVSEKRDAAFVLRDRKTDAPTIIAYDSVSKVDINRGHSTARNTGLGVGIGAGAVLLTLAILLASLDD